MLNVLDVLVSSHAVLGQYKVKWMFDLLTRVARLEMETDGEIMNQTPLRGSTASERPSVLHSCVL